MAVCKASNPDDDMVDGDLGDGTGARASSNSSCKLRQSSALSESLLPQAPPLWPSGQAGESAWSARMKTAKIWKTPHCGSLDDLSKDELKDRLQEANEVIDALSCELEVAHRYLEGKFQALKILQGKAILDKATSHIKVLLQRSEERTNALEKEVNGLQWELSFSQVQMKRSEQSWEQKYNGLYSENKALTDNLQKSKNEIQGLRAENSALNRECQELLSMLNVREQKVYDGTKPQNCHKREAGVLELAVLGACRCLGADACPCSHTAANSRRQLVQLQQEIDAQHLRREEALMVADAFRIAFEQQLRKRRDCFLLLAETNMKSSQNFKTQGLKMSPFIGVSQRLRGLLPSNLDLMTPDALLETLYRLMDLLNDKDEALAHQRKVSIMLAHSAEELQKQLQLDSLHELSGLSKVDSQCKRPHNTPTDHSTRTADPSESNVHERLQPELPSAQAGQSQALSHSGTEPQELSKHPAPVSPTRVGTMKSKNSTDQDQ